MDLGRNITYERLLSQSVYNHVLISVCDGVFKRKCLMEK